MIGFILLFAALVFHIAYTVYCIIKKSYQPKVKGILRFLSLFALIFLLLLGKIYWDFTSVPLFFILGILSALSVLYYIRHPAVKPFRIGKSIVSGFMSFLLIVTALVPMLLFPPYTLPASSGEYTVATLEASYSDISRIESYDASGKNREVNVGFWFPDVQGQRFPLIIFDHGFCGIKNSNESTFRELASHGYVVLSIDHPYQSFYTVNEQGETTIISGDYLREYSSIGDDLSGNLSLLHKWTEIRIADTNFVIDTILAKADDDGVYSLVNKEFIGIFGHSLGGGTATAMARVRDDIDAVINLDGPMPYEITGVVGDKYTVISEPYPVPIQSIYSQYLYDNGIVAGDPLYTVNSLVCATAPEHYSIVLEGAEHMSLTDLVLFSPFLATMLNSGRQANVDPYECLAIMNEQVVSFFDKVLKNK